MMQRGSACRVSAGCPAHVVAKINYGLYQNTYLVLDLNPLLDEVVTKRSVYANGLDLSGIVLLFAHLSAFIQFEDGLYLFLGAQRKTAVQLRLAYLR